MTESSRKWVLFALLVFCVPVVFVAPAAGLHYIPVFRIAVMAVEYTALMVQVGMSGYAIVALVHLVPYAVALYLVSKYIARALTGPKRGGRIFVAICVALLAVTLLPVYGFEGGDSLYGMYAELLRL